MSAAPSTAADGETNEELVTRVGRARWTTGNTAELLVDPRSAWRARVELAESAQHHLLVSVFSWHNDGYGKAYRRTLQEIMTQRSDDGIELAVRVLADASALNLFDQAFVELEDHGAKVRGFNRSSWGLTPLYDLRMHDKMVIADGRTAIVGGRNVSDLYFDPARWWLDLGVKVAGPVVADLQMIFLKSWELTRFNRSFRRYVLPQEMLVDELRTFWTTGRFPNGRSPLEPYMTTDYFPPFTSPAGAVRVAVLYDNPLIRRRAATVDLVAALAGRAEHSIDLMTPFPNFPPELTEALAGAAMRGVRVRLFVNGRDAAIRGGPFRLAGYPTLVRLMEAGAEVWAWAANGDHTAAAAGADCDPDLTPPIALHGKMARFDDELSIVTSSNFNIRSAYYNTEAGVVVLDREFNRDLEDLVEGLIANDRRAFRCVDPSTDLAGSPLLRRLDAGDAARMRDELQGKQGFLDRWGVAW
jgi:putative cardiolipin synthase